MSYSQQGVIFPVSAAILDHIKDYGNVLESYSHPLLEFIEWESTADHNVKITNTLSFDQYKYGGHIMPPPPKLRLRKILSTPCLQYGIDVQDIGPGNP